MQRTSAETQPMRCIALHVSKAAGHIFFIRLVILAEMRRSNFMLFAVAVGFDVLRFQIHAFLAKGYDI